MKKIILLLGILSFNAIFYAQNVKKIAPNTKLLIYYFHITHRCNTCIKIEAITKKILETYYADELKKGVIIFQAFNCELPENKALVDKYQAYGSTLALTPIVNGKEAGIEDLTSFAFSKINNEEIFTKELQEKINSYLR